MTRTFTLPYGSDKLVVSLPETGYVGTFLPAKLRQGESDEEVVQHALSHPIGTVLLAALVKPGQKVVIVTSDMTRPCPNRTLLPPVLRELNSAGIPDWDITIVIGLGLHRPMTEEELRKSVGDDVFERVKVLNHDSSDVVHVGRTRRGTEIEVFRPVVEADFRICLGNVEFHYFAGFSGGAKAIVPGVASARTVNRNHSHMTKDAAVAAELAGNPVREDLEEAVDFVGVDFILNVIVDENHRIVDARAGHVTQAHRALCERLSREGVVALDRKLDLAIVSAGGDPKDINLYQAQKALDNCAGVVREQGVIILLAECVEGYGSGVFQDWMTSAGEPSDLLAALQREFVLGGHKAAAIAKVALSAHVFLVTSDVLGTEQMVGVTVVRTFNQALQQGARLLGEGYSYGVFPLGASTLPKVGTTSRKHKN